MPRHAMTAEQRKAHVASLAARKSSPLQPDRKAVEEFIKALFRYADADAFISVRAFHDIKDNEPPLFVASISTGSATLIDFTCSKIAQAANQEEPYVFCPPICTFKTADNARQENVAEGIVLSVECDKTPSAARKRLTEILGTPTAVVFSGGLTDEREDKVHLHWRLKDPVRDADGFARLREARKLAAELVDSDHTAISVVHPLRWPGSWHRKNITKPRLARVEINSDAEIELSSALNRLRELQPQPATKDTPSSKNYHRYYTGQTQASLNEIEEALAVVPNPDLEWAEWNRIGMALWAASGGQAFNAFDRWSAKSSKYDAAKTAARWEHYSISPPNRIGAGTIFFLANQAAPGWRGNGPRDSQAKTQTPHWSEGSFTGEELRAMTFPPISWIAADIIPAEGVTLLCSKPKFGKSWLAYDLCIASTMDRFTLGTIKPAQGDVLYLALEDSKRRLQRRMSRLLPTFNGAWPRKLTINTQWKRLHEGGLDDVRAWHDHTKVKGKPILVVIDVLAKVRRPTGNRPAYEADYEALAGLASLANELGIAIIVIHHTRKMAADDLMEMVSGSFGLTGAVDTILVMANKASGAVLDVRGRDVESSELAIQFSKETCRWTVLGAAAEIHISEQRSKIAAALKEANAPMTVTALMEATGIKRNALDLLLSRMAKAGEVKRIKTGLYAHKDYTPPEPDKPGKGRSVAPVRDRQMSRQMNEPAQATDNKENKSDFCQSVGSVSPGTHRAQDGFRTPAGNELATSLTDQTDRQISLKTDDKPATSGVAVDLSDAHAAATDQTETRGKMIANGFSKPPEDRRPLEPGELTCRVWIREVHHPAIKSGPDDSLDDFAPPL